MKIVRLLIVALLVFSGCEKMQSSRDNKRKSDFDRLVRSDNVSAEERKLNDQAIEALIEAEKSAPPAAVIDLPIVNGWTKPDSRRLPQDGMSVAYNHAKRLTVTLYQYSRGLASVPTDIDAEVIKQEYANSRDGLEQIVEMGLYDSLELQGEGVVALGDSKTKAHWASYLGKIGEEESLSEVYIWSCNIRFFKIRITTSTHRSRAMEEALTELLTAIGNSGAPDA